MIGEGHLPTSGIDDDISGNAGILSLNAPRLSSNTFFVISVTTASDDFFFDETIAFLNFVFVFRLRFLSSEYQRF